MLAAVRNPACRPMTMLTFTPGSERLSRLSPMNAAATNLAALPKPGQWSVTRRSLSIVFGTWKTRSSYRASLAISLTMCVVSAESLPPM